MNRPAMLPIITNITVISGRALYSSDEEVRLLVPPTTMRLEYMEAIRLARLPGSILFSFQRSDESNRRINRDADVARRVLLKHADPNDYKGSDRQIILEIQQRQNLNKRQ